MDFQYDGYPRAPAAFDGPERGTFSYDSLGRRLPPIGSADYDLCSAWPLGLVPLGGWAEYGSPSPPATVTPAGTPPHVGPFYDSYGRALTVVDVIGCRTNMMYDATAPEADAPLIVPTRPSHNPPEAP